MEWEKSAYFSRFVTLSYRVLRFSPSEVFFMMCFLRDVLFLNASWVIPSKSWTGIGGLLCFFLSCSLSFVSLVTILTFCSILSTLYFWALVSFHSLNENFVSFSEKKGSQHVHFGIHITSIRKQIKVGKLQSKSSITNLNLDFPLWCNHSISKKMKL